ncbi:MAG: PAS domain-containing protein, partial [Leptospiraceae bacterium]|nr:PAS domain-containing protein [Leptospiraceae bacterium]
MAFESDDQTRPAPDFEAENRALRHELEAVRAAHDSIQNNAFAIIDNTPDLIWSVDDQLRLMAFNQAFKEAQHRIVGREPRIGDFILYDVYNPDWLKEWELRYRKALAGEHVEWESTYPDDGGGIRYYRITLNPIRNQSGQISGVCGMNRDISDFRSMEEQLRSENRQRRAAEMRMQQLAYYDNLTGLPLRAKLLQILQEQIDSGERKFSHVSLVDIDRFRDINQSLGYEIGDAFLRE